LDQITEAANAFERALELRPRFPAAYNNLGNALKRQGNLVGAMEAYYHAVQLDPCYAEAYYNLGYTQEQSQLPIDAINSYREALRLNPRLAEACNNLGIALVTRNNITEGAALLEHALTIKPQFAEVWINLGIAKQKQNQFLAAQECYAKAIEIKPDFAAAHENLGLLHLTQGKLHDALHCFDTALRLNPGLSATHWNRAILRLLLGNYEQGWPEYEWRWTQPNFAKREFSQPVWDGFLEGYGTVLLHAEQGLGDTFQFVRYAVMAGRRRWPYGPPTRKLIVECQTPLCIFLEMQPGIKHLLPRGASLPPFDFHAPFGSLPGIFSTTLDSVPAPIPYLIAQLKLVEKWRQQLSKVQIGDLEVANSDSRFSTSDFLAGIAWQGNPTHGHDAQRSIPLENFAPLARIPGVRLISLQKTSVVNSQGSVSSYSHFGPLPLIPRPLCFPLDEDAGPFMDTAAVMQSLDLVITSDTSIAHLTGAMGMPVWVALPSVPDWRWLLDREDCPWYPSMRLFRQKRAGDWEDVFNVMGSELEKVLNQRQMAEVG
jgi:tetratricopeptide (TPR) repeat protein